MPENPKIIFSEQDFLKTFLHILCQAKQVTISIIIRWRFHLGDWPRILALSPKPLEPSAEYSGKLTLTTLISRRNEVLFN